MRFRWPKGGGPSISAAVRRDAAVPGEPEVWVRIDPDHLDEDVAAAAGPRTRGIVLAKAEPERVAALDVALAGAERRSGLADGSLAVIALIESASGVLSAPEVAAGARVVRLGLGEADLAGKLGLHPQRGAHRAVGHPAADHARRDRLGGAAGPGENEVPSAARHPTTTVETRPAVPPEGTMFRTDAASSG